MSKKAIFLIVEGFSEEQTFENILDDALRDNATLVLKVYRGDITSDRETNSSNIKKKLGDFVNNHLNRLRYKKQIY